MTSAPQAAATAAISGSSVEQATRWGPPSSADAAARAVRTARPTRGMPPIGRRFLPGTRLLPPRAGTRNRMGPFTTRRAYRSPEWPDRPARYPADHAGAAQPSRRLGPRERPRVVGPGPGDPGAGGPARRPGDPRRHDRELLRRGARLDDGRRSGSGARCTRAGCSTPPNTIRQELERIAGGWPERAAEPAWTVDGGLVDPFRDYDTNYPDRRRSTPPGRRPTPPPTRSSAAPGWSSSRSG